MSAGAVDAKHVTCKHVLPGTPRSACFTWPFELKNVNEMEGQFAGQEYLQLLMRKDIADVATMCKLPEGMGINLWAYEHLRAILIDMHFLITMLNGECNEKVCPIMTTSGDLQFKCANHGDVDRDDVKDCCAIDYALHSLARYRSMLTSASIFPSRVRVNDQQARRFRDILRRLWRVFAHVSFAHEAVFKEFEAKTHACHRFVHLCTLHDLVGEGQLVPALPHTAPMQACDVCSTTAVMMTPG